MPSDASNRVGAGLGSAPFCVGELRWGAAPSPENSHSRAVLCLRQTRSLRFSISAMLNPAQRAHGFNPPKEPEVPVPPVLTAARSGEKSGQREKEAVR